MKQMKIIPEQTRTWIFGHCQVPAPAELAAKPDHIKPGLRGRYRVQSPNSRADTSTIGNVIRMPCATAMLSVASLTPAGGYDEHGRHAAFDPDSARRLLLLSSSPPGFCFWQGQRSMS